MEKTLFNLVNEGTVKKFIEAFQHSDRNPDKINSELGTTLLHAGINRITIVKYLLKIGANPNVQTTSTKNTPLHCVKRLDVAKLLIKSGADPNIVNSEGLTSHYYASGDVLKYLLSISSVDKKKLSTGLKSKIKKLQSINAPEYLIQQLKTDVQIVKLSK